MFINTLIEKIVGKNFEIDCHDIEVHGTRDHCPPLYKGPGVISAQKRGHISFKLYNQIQINPEVLISLNKTEDQQPIRIFAKDYNGHSWSGGWANYDTRFIFDNIIKGHFNQLSIRIEKHPDDSTKNTTEIVFDEILKLPYTQKGEQKRYSAGKQIFHKIWSDRHEMNFFGSKISIFQSSDEKRTHITAEHRDGFGPPYCETWLSEALQFITGCQIWPRVSVRHFEKDGLVFIRDYPFSTRSGMPSPLCGLRESSVLWNMYATYLSHCEKHQQFEILKLTRILSEVIIASTGTVQAFVLSLVVCIENMVAQLYNDLNIHPIDNETLNSLKNHIKLWDGEYSVKERALGLISMLKSKDIKNALRKLISDGVIEKKHLKAWSSMRPFITHGGLIDYQTDDEWWKTRNVLISMVYRLAYRIIGYKGKIIDHDDSNINLKDFHWSQNQ